MNINDALNLLSLTSPSTQVQIKKAYKTASLQCHPDRNPAGAQMMLAVNAAYELLKGLGDIVETDKAEKQSGFNGGDYSKEFNDVLNSLLVLEGLIIEICGGWIWIDGETKQHSKILGRKEGGLGCRWASKKKKWYFRPEEYKSSSRKNTSMDDIRATHGSTTPFKTTRKVLAA